MKVSTALIAIVSSLTLYACGSSGSVASTGSSGLTQAQVQALISQAVTPLQNQIATLQSQVGALQSSSSAAPAIFIRAPNAPAVKVASQPRGVSAKATPSTCTGIGTLTGRPNNSDPLSTDNISGVSCTGYYFTISGAATSADSAIVQPAPAAVTIGYDGPGCTGNAYALASFNGTGITEGAVANGAVFRAYSGTNDPTNPSSYLMLKAGTTLSSPNILSVLQGSSCSSFSGQLSGYPLVTNDQTVSGVASAPIPGPVTIG